MNFYQIATSPSFLNLSEEEVGIIISGDIADVNKQAENGLQSRPPKMALLQYGLILQ